MSNPSKMEFNINDIIEAVEYWLNNRVCRESVEVTKVQFSSQKNQFIVEIDTPKPPPKGDRDG